MRGKRPLSLALRVLSPLLMAASFFVVPAQAVPPTVEKVRVQTHEGFTRVVLDTNAPIEPNLFTMPRPHRLVIDLPELHWRLPRPSGYVDSPLVRKYSFGLFQPGVSRLVLILSGPTQVLRRKLSRSGRYFTYEIDLANMPSSLPPGANAPAARAPEALPNLESLPLPERVSVQSLPEASTVDPATKSVFRARRFDPDTAQFDLLSSVLNGKAPDESRVEANELVVVPADAGERAVRAAPATVALPTVPTPAAPVIVAPNLAVAPVSAPAPLDVAPVIESYQTAALPPEVLPNPTPEPIILAQKVVPPPPLPPAPMLPPLLPVKAEPAKEKTALKAKADPTPKKEQKAAAKPEVADEIEKMEPEKSKRPPLRIVLDPGHGGRDPGTGSNVEVTEKEINLKFALLLADLLKKDPRYEVFLTRETDVRVRLPKRVEFARRKDADLFISIHADWSMNKRAKGATAYTLSEKASVAALDDLATKREKAGKVAGVDLAAERADVARLLVDLARRETQARSLKFAELVVAEVAKETPVLRRPLRRDSFHVLKAPDMPSVLLELGFLSNETDRERLQSPAWQLKTAKAVKRAIDEFRRVTGARDFANR